MTQTSHIVLYHGMASTCSKKVRMCLYEKGLAFESRLLDLQRFEQHAPEYLAVNPNGVVPSLVVNGTPVIESSVIIEFIDDRFPEPVLRPEDMFDRAKMRLWTKYSDESAYKAVYAPTWHHLRSRATQGLAEDRLRDTLSRVPSAERKARWEKMASGGFSDQELDEAYDRMAECLQKVDDGLQRGPWLAGKDYSLADIAMIPFVDRINNLRPDLFDRKRLSRLADWYDRMRDRPAFAKAFNFRDDPRAAALPNL
jgi:glutathione S-transferase